MDVFKWHPPTFYFYDLCICFFSSSSSSRFSYFYGNLLLTITYLRSITWSTKTCYIYSARISFERVLCLHRCVISTKIMLQQIGVGTQHHCCYVYIILICILLCLYTPSSHDAHDTSCATFCNSISFHLSRLRKLTEWTKERKRGKRNIVYISELYRNKCVPTVPTMVFRCSLQKRDKINEKILLFGCCFSEPPISMI